MSLLLLLMCCVVVGIFVGAVGVGGVLLIPALMTFANLNVHEAAATALFTFLFTGLLGTWLFIRKGSIEWKVSIPVCGGALLLSFAGAMVGAWISAAILVWIVAAILFGAGLYVLLPRARPTPADPPAADRHGAMLFGVGALSGFGAGLSGAGGPLFSVPLMLALHFDPLVSVGAGQAVQIASALSGTFGNIGHDTIQWGLALPVTLAEMTGVIAGVRIAHVAQGRQLRIGAALLCMISAIGLAIKTLTA